jgi:hypothetical protein
MTSMTSIAPGLVDWAAALLGIGGVTGVGEGFSHHGEEYWE